MAIGVDLYERYQQVDSWASVRRAGYQFCYMKVGDGTSTRGVTKLHPESARAAGIACGGYWYAQPGNAAAQANLLCNQAERLGLTGLAPALDLESPFVPNQTAINFAIAFCRQVKARGHRPCLYANNSMLRTVRAPVLAAVPETRIWVARYGAKPTVGYDVWQHSDAGHVPGIRAGSVDLNTGTIPTNTRTVTNPTIKELLEMNLSDKIRYKNRHGTMTEITVHDCLARLSLLFDDQQFGAPGQRTDGPWASVFRQMATKAGIGVPK